ncbi:hypothetical protein [Chlorobium sp.]|jgi:hypothetical protein|uniref:hypothetical protein n=1 Tax=Chlorobium sp. TaxID=1095 RepID=UPI003C319669|nr:hypothetical protein [Chlorobiaceae bacterium]NTW93806.1 hypothetical protein [Chlorobiaceae bacterium]
MVYRTQLKRAGAALAILFFCSAWMLPAEQKPDCDIHGGACSKTAGNTTVTLEISPRPVRHMQELLFSVTVKPCSSLPDTLLLDLSMPGMEMGKNQVTLVRKSNCLYQGKGLIVKCMSGRKLWKATVLSEKMNNPAFTFDVRD